MVSMVRTEIRVPAGMVTYAGTCVPATVPASLRREVAGRTGMSLPAISLSNFSEVTSARSYFCTDEPTWKLISLSVPPMNLPLIRLPFFSSKESAHARDAPSHRATTNPQFSFNFTLTSPLQRSCFLLLVQVDWDGWGSHDRTHPVLLGHLSGFLFGDQVGLLR